MMMGSGNLERTCSFESAANRLKRSKRQVHNYVKDGFITRVMQDGKVLLRWEDVEQLAVDLGADTPALNRKNFFHLTARVRRLEEEMIAVKHILEIRDDPMRPNPEEAQALYAAASESLGRRKWGFDEIRLWTRQFERMDEASLDLFRDALGDPKPWKVFYDLCLEMMKVLGKETGIEGLALHRKLDEGRKKLRGSILIWLEMGRGSLPENVFSLLDTSKERVLRKASWG